MADRRPARPASQVAALARHAIWLLGDRRRWLVVLPALAVSAALLDLALMVSLIRALLLLADETAPRTASLPGLGERSIGFLLGLAAAAGVASTVLRAGEAAIVGRLVARAAATARQQVIDAQLRASWRSVAAQRIGFVQSLLGTHTQYAANAPMLLAVVVSTLTSLVVYGAFVVVSSPLVAGLFVVLGVTASAAFSTVRARMGRAAKDSASAATDVQLLATSLHGLSRELRVFGVTGAARAELAKANARARRMLATVRARQRFLPLLFQQIVLLLVIALVAVASWADLEAGTFGAAAILAVRSLSYLQQLNGAMQSFVEAKPFLDELHAAVADVRAAAEVRGDEPLSTVQEIALRDVDFAYGNVPVLDGVSATFRAGERVGIVGSSGAGKTTLLGILTGLLRPDGGTILVNGRTLYDYDGADWARQVALVGQETNLLRGTVGENIAFYRDVPGDAIREAAARASLLEDLESLEDGFDTLVGDGHADLSGGQRQRVAIARALVGRPSLLVLDEPTSALDDDNAARVAEALDHLDGAPIVLVVTHRPELLATCDRVVRLRGGRLEPDGRGPGGRDAASRRVRRRGDPAARRPAR